MVAARSYEINREAHAVRLAQEFVEAKGCNPSNPIAVYPDQASLSAYGENVNLLYRKGERMGNAAVKLRRLIKDVEEEPQNVLVVQKIEEILQGLARVVRQHLGGASVDYVASPNDVAQRGDARALEQALTWLLQDVDNVAEIHEAARDEYLVLDLAIMEDRRVVEDPFLMKRLIDRALVERRGALVGSELTEVEEALKVLIHDIVKKTN